MVDPADGSNLPTSGRLAASLAQAGDLGCELHQENQLTTAALSDQLLYRWLVSPQAIGMVLGREETGAGKVDHNPHWKQANKGRWPGCLGETSCQGNTEELSCQANIRSASLARGKRGAIIIAEI